MLQLTHKTEDLNVWQETRNGLALKSRLKIQYKGFANVEPYGLLELKNVLNDPLYKNGSFSGYTDAYITRYRGGLRPGRLLLREEYRHQQGRHQAQEPHLRPEVQHDRRNRLHLLVLSPNPVPCRVV